MLNGLYFFQELICVMIWLVCLILVLVSFSATLILFSDVNCLCIVCDLVNRLWLTFQLLFSCVLFWNMIVLVFCSFFYVKLWFKVLIFLSLLTSFMILSHKTIIKSFFNKDPQHIDVNTSYFDLEMSDFVLQWVTLTLKWLTLTLKRLHVMWTTRLLFQQY